MKFSSLSLAVASASAGHANVAHAASNLVVDLAYAKYQGIYNATSESAPMAQPIVLANKAYISTGSILGITSDTQLLL